MKLHSSPAHDADHVSQARIRGEDVTTKVTVLSALRYTFANPSPSYDETLAPCIMDFLSLMSDSDLVHASSLFDQAAQYPNYAFMTECAEAGIVSAERRGPVKGAPNP